MGNLQICMFSIFLFFICSWVSQTLGFQPDAHKVAELRSRLMYPYSKTDYLEDITDTYTQIEKLFVFQIPFLGFSYNYSWISIHGSMLFSRSPARFEYPLKFPVDEWPAKSDPSFIGVFYSKSLIGSAGSGSAEMQLPAGVYYSKYRNIGYSDEQEASLKEAIRQDIVEGIVGATDFDPNHVVIVTWKNLTFAGSNKKNIVNSYQVLLATDQIRTYAIFNYELIKWISNLEAGGDSSGMRGNPAYVGFNAGNGTRAFEYKPYSQGKRIVDLVTKGGVNGHPGRHIFRVDEEIFQGTCNFEPEQVSKLIISPESGNMLGGTVVNITGPCFEPNVAIRLRFYDQQVECHYISRRVATCVTPRIFTTGFVDVVYRTNTPNSFKSKFYIENPYLATELVKISSKTINHLEEEQLELYWSRTNLSYSIRDLVSINLWGYSESRGYPELVLIDTLVKATPNDGLQEIDLTLLQNRDNGHSKEFQIGLLQITLNDIHSDERNLWSRPIPLGWYFKKQWENAYGSNWAEKFCKDWFMEDQENGPFAHELPKCPCTLDQANVDHRFVPDTYCDENGNRDCFESKQIFHCVHSGQPSFNGGGQHCCYGMDKNLMMNTDFMITGFSNRAHPFGSHPFDRNRTVPGLSYWYNDLRPLYTCCIWQSEMTESCFQFKWLRASQDCKGYRPPNASTVFGDPHFITFDNLQYTFNGLGEFSLVNVRNEKNHLDVQGRFEQLVDNNRAIKLRAASLTSVAVRDNLSSIIEIQKRPLYATWRYRLSVLVDKKPVFFDKPLFYHNLRTFKGVTVYSPKNILNQSIVIVSFQSGAAVQILENDGIIAAVVFLPNSYKETTRGLLGNWSDNMSDDFILPDGNILSHTSSDKIIYEQFGLHWSVSDSESGSNSGIKSLFYHEFGRSTASYYNSTYSPEFLRNPPLPSSISLQDIDKTCGRMAYQCRYDYIMTLNKDFAEVTMFNLVSFLTLKDKGLKTIVTCGALATPCHGRKSTSDTHIGTEVKYECEKGYELEGASIRRCNSKGEWSPSEMVYTRCKPKLPIINKDQDFPFVFC